MDRRANKSRRWFPPVVAFVATALLPATLLAGTLQGQLTDSMTGTPIPGATIRVLETDQTAKTDDQGRWSFELPEGEYRLGVEATLGETTHRFRVVNQHVPQYKPADTQLPTDYFLEQGVPRKSRPLGAPVPRIDHPSRQGGSYDLEDLPETDPEFGPRKYTLPATPPVSLRVARREHKETCYDSPIVAIEKIPLDSYVKGVLAPEIGVFRNQPNALEVFKAFAPAAKSYGIWFLLRHRAGKRRTVDTPRPPHGFEWFHLDDTPCNQRYGDMRFETPNRAAEMMAGKLLVKEGAPETVDKFEYAASCAGHGSRPEYQSAIVPDDSPVTSCVGDWCGHETCAGHADHPDVAGEDRCLVRGICQWGALEWAETGRRARWILDHYQPNLMLRDLDSPPDIAEPAPDVGPTPADTGPSPSDAGPGDAGLPDEPADSGIGPTVKAYGGLGPMIGPSSGAQAGCQTATLTQHRPIRRPPVWLGLVALGLLGWRSCRTR